MIAKEGQHEIELAVFASRHEAGARAIRDWLYMRRDGINSKWTALEGNDLVKLQGEAASITRLIKLIELGPKIKATEGKPNV